MLTVPEVNLVTKHPMIFYSGYARTAAGSHVVVRAMKFGGAKFDEFWETQEKSHSVGDRLLKLSSSATPNIDWDKPLTGMMKSNAARNSHKPLEQKFQVHKL